jgi:hypothetical protein
MSYCNKHCSIAFLKTLCNLPYADVVSWVVHLRRKQHWDTQIVLVDNVPTVESMDCDCVYVVQHDGNIATVNRGMIGINCIVYKASSTSQCYVVYRSKTDAFGNFMKTLHTMNMDEAEMAITRLYPDICIRTFKSDTRSMMSLRPNTINLCQYSHEVRLNHVNYGLYSGCFNISIHNHPPL